MSSDPLKIPKRPTVLELTQDRGRLIAIGDVHGCISELTKLLFELKPTENDTIIFVGDLVDRGPDSPEVVRMVYDLCCGQWINMSGTRIETQGNYCIMGNHDEKLVRWWHHKVKRAIYPEYKIPMKPRDAKDQHDDMAYRHIGWLSTVPQAAVVDTPHGRRIFTHAGLIKGLAFDQKTSGLIRNRYLDANTWSPKHCIKDEHGQWHQPPDSVLWDEIWDGPRVIYGHIVHDLKTPRIKNDCYGIDTGCVFGGHLTAYVEHLEDGFVEFVQVQANDTYCQERNME